MADVIPFTSRSEVDAKTNVADFIALCRERLQIFGAELDFDSWVWDVSADVNLKGMSKKVRAVFSSWATANDNPPQPMAEPFASLAKAYFRYQHGMRPTKAIGSRLAALRALSAAMLEQNLQSSWLVHAGILNRASQLIKEKFSGDNGYRTATQLEMLAAFMDEHRLVSVPLQWRNPIRRLPSNTGRVGKEFDERREEKLPSPFALDALARAFRAAEAPIDQVVTGIAAILCSAPDRVNEVLGLRAACEVRQPQKNGSVAYGLRYWPSKGADPMIKWIVQSMATVVEEALDRIRSVTEQARQVALWYENNPEQMFLPDHLEHLRSRSVLSASEAAEVLFAGPVKPPVTLQWCRDRGVKFEVINRKAQINFASLEIAVLALLPPGFPYLDRETGLLYSEALCTIRRNELHETKVTLCGVIEFVSYGTVATGLGSRSENGFRSTFDRLQFLDQDGSPIEIRSHQFRHYLDTLATAGGLSELDIAKWSGRKDIRQNSAYNHVSDRDMQHRLKELTNNGERPFGELVSQTRVSLVPREEFARLNIAAAHLTDFGFCAHDFAMSPCQLHMDCSNCNEQVCVKGDLVGEQNARRRLAETQDLLLQAEAAESEHVYGATPWVEHQRRIVARLTQLIEILDDPRVPERAVIRLAPTQQASRFRQAIENRKLLTGDADPQDLQLAWQVQIGVEK